MKSEGISAIFAILAIFAIFDNFAIYGQSMRSSTRGRLSRDVGISPSIKVSSRLRYAHH
jgi:hypothetical protein